MIEAGDPEYAPSLLEDYEKHLAEARRCLDEAAARGDATADLETRMSSLDKKHDLLLIDYADELSEFVGSAVAAARRNSNYLGSGGLHGVRDDAAAAGVSGREPADG